MDVARYGGMMASVVFSEGARHLYPWSGGRRDGPRMGGRQRAAEVPSRAVGGV